MFDTLGKTDSAHRAGGPTPYRGWIPPERWVGGASILPPKPTAQGGFFPPERWVWGARCLPLPPTAQGGSTPYRGWAYLHGGQSPFSPQLKTNFAPPCPSLPPLLAVVTAMEYLKLVASREIHHEVYWNHSDLIFIGRLRHAHWLSKHRHLSIRFWVGYDSRMKVHVNFFLLYFYIKLYQHSALNL